MSADIIFELRNDDYKKRCGEVFLTEKGYLLFHCQLCSDKFAEYDDFWTHIITNHVFEYDSGAAELADEPGQGVEEPENDFLFDKYIEEVKNTTDQNDSDEENETSDQAVLERGNQEELQQKRSSKTAMNNSNDSAAETSKNSNLKKFKCKRCGVAFKLKCNLTTHLLRHTGEKSFFCAECGKSFITNTELKTHLRRHRNERPYLCQECGEAFVTSGTLTIHTKRRHKNIRNIPCPQCSKLFYDKASLYDHQFVHTKGGSKPHVCSICQSSFPRRKSLMNHMKLHWNKREYVCELCGESFNQRPGLTSHMRRSHKADF